MTIELPRDGRASRRLEISRRTAQKGSAADLLVPHGHPPITSGQFGDKSPRKLCAAKIVLHCPRQFIACPESCPIDNVLMRKASWRLSTESHSLY
ncbi:hypothetical protein QZM22_16395 [Burkholderia oklahomensis]|uniref:hypothetical protein n=1 Tax=Burkholderia oklahomensis TaxID=342113 RepID=UPI00264C2D97|nr:hypothetical protein [Burkholderia oklahomensis]MDN7674063.1 hypothetical protein [Burkholderia oklahomensis]